MPRVDLVDETFVVAAPDEVARVVHDPDRWRRWWPDLDLTVFMDRGEAGIRWSVTGPLHGSTELWLEPVGDGVVVHYFLRAQEPARERDVGERDVREPRVREPVGAAARRRDARAADKLRNRRAVAWKRCANALKDELEGGRAPGEPRTSG